MPTEESLKSITCPYCLVDVNDSTDRSLARHIRKSHPNESLSAAYARVECLLIEAFRSGQQEAPEVFKLRNLAPKTAARAALVAAADRSGRTFEMRPGLEVECVEAVEQLMAASRAVRKSKEVNNGRLV